MGKFVLAAVALSGLLAACGGGSPSGVGTAPAPSTALLNNCAVCQRENPGNYDGCAQVCTAAGLWGPGSDDVPGRR
jgi:hypothetical protein